MTEFHLGSHIKSLHDVTPHQFGFTADNHDAAIRWQHVFRSALLDCLKISDRTLPDTVTTEILSSTDKDTYIEEKHELVVDGVPANLYVLVPKTEPPYIPVIAFHGHGMGVHMILGNYSEHHPSDRFHANDENFAQKLAQDGYLVFAIEQRGFGERVTDQLNQPEAGNACRHLAFAYMMHGQTLLGERVWDGMHVVSYALGRDDIQADQLSCVGFSGGGTTALSLSALDTRIKQAIIKSYFCKLEQSILGMRHCECNYVPNLLTLGDTGDIAGLIAPRPVQIISGETDPIFPIDGVREQYARLEHIYQIFGADDQCTLSIHPDGHRANYGMMKGWIERQI